MSYQSNRLLSYSQLLTDSSGKYLAYLGQIALKDFKVKPQNKFVADFMEEVIAIASMEIVAWNRPVFITVPTKVCLKRFTGYVSAGHFRVAMTHYQSKLLTSQRFL